MNIRSTLALATAICALASPAFAQHPTQGQLTIDALKATFQVDDWAFRNNFNTISQLKLVNGTVGVPAQVHQLGHSNGGKETSDHDGSRCRAWGRGPVIISTVGFRDMTVCTPNTITDDMNHGGDAIVVIDVPTGTRPVCNSHERGENYDHSGSSLLATNWDKFDVTEQSSGACK